MKYEYQYKDEASRQVIIDDNSDKYLIEDRNIQDGNFLVFTDIKPIDIEIKDLKQENKLLKSQNKATSERADFIEDIIAEMAMKVYQ